MRFMGSLATAIILMVAAVPAASTFKSLWPTATHDITASCRLIGKPLRKLLVVSQIVLSCDRTCSGVHREAYCM